MPAILRKEKLQLSLASRVHLSSDSLQLLELNQDDVILVVSGHIFNIDSSLCLGHSTPDCGVALPSVPAQYQTVWGRGG